MELSSGARGEVKYDIVHMHDQTTRKKGCFLQTVSCMRDVFRGPKSQYFRRKKSSFVVIRVMFINNVTFIKIILKPLNPRFRGYFENNLRSLYVPPTLNPLHLTRIVCPWWIRLLTLCNRLIYGIAFSLYLVGYPVEIEKNIKWKKNQIKII